METNIEAKVSQQLSTDPFIGDQVADWKEAAGFKGAISRESNLSNELHPGPAEIALHERGIKIWNTYYEREFEIHFSQLINLDRIEVTESYLPEKSVLGGVLFAILLVITLGILAFALTDAGKTKSEKRTRYISCLVIKFKDANTKSVRKILISGSKRRIERFMSKYDKRLIKIS